jgi:hypothetical protein
MRITDVELEIGVPLVFGSGGRREQESGRQIIEQQPAVVS